MYLSTEWEGWKGKYLAQGSVQYCAKVMQINFDEIPGFLWLFEEISLATIFPRIFVTPIVLICLIFLNDNSLYAMTHREF